MEKCLCSTPVKIRKYISNVHKIGGAHLQCMNNDFAKFEYTGMNTIWVTDYTNLTPSTHFGWKKMSKFNTRKNEKIFIKCARKRRCTSLMYEQSLGKALIKEWKLLELQITQTRHPKSVADWRTDRRTTLTYQCIIGDKAMTRTQQHAVCFNA